MRQDGAMWAAAPNMTGRETEEGLRLLEESQGLLAIIILGVLLQYRSLDLERARLLGGCTSIEPKDMQAAASLVTLGALFGFQRQSQQLAWAQAEGPVDWTDVELGAVSIGVALIRLFRLMGGNGQVPAEEELVEPVV